MEKYLIRIYQQINNIIECGTNPLKQIWKSCSDCNVIGIKNNEYELYAAFNPFVTNEKAFQECKKILRIIKKDDNLFFTTTTTWQSKPK